MKLIDLTGERFGALTVTRRNASDPTRKTTWICLCDCGLETSATGLNLKTGNTTSCGCARKKPAQNRVDLTGRTFGRLVVREPAGSDKRRTLWLCSCECGNSTTAQASFLMRGVTSSCGCLRRENGSKRWKGLPTRGRAKWSRSVLANAACLKCGSVDRLHAHHVLPVSLYPELKFDTTNGAPLCDTCHRRFHQEFPLPRCNHVTLSQWLR